MHEGALPEPAERRVLGREEFRALPVEVVSRESGVGVHRPSGLVEAWRFEDQALSKSSHPQLIKPRNHHKYLPKSDLPSSPPRIPRRGARELSTLVEARTQP
jgi:hypothetical protein